MKTKTTNLYSFAELTGSARAAALENARNFAGEHFDSESTIEDAKECLAFCGLTVDRVFYSGFWSQGDGACFEGSWKASDVNPAGMKEHAPADTELHRIADGFAAIAALMPFASFTVRHRGHYYHKFCTDFTVSLVDENDDELPEAVTGTAKADLIELARDAMEWIYRQMEKNYDWETSEKQVLEYLENDEREIYTAEGHID
jgi:hypothetical protein